jgi:peptidoglycan/xylan/chitin deacetylase (PgdA/CDA1 family)
MSAKIRFRKTVSSFLSAAGILRLLERFRLRDKAFILLYHRVLRPGDEQAGFIQPGMYVYADAFERQIRFLKKHFRVLTLEALIERVRRNEQVGRCCAVTFDDGWRDNYVNAFPVLRKHHVPATIFLATGFIDTERMFWHDELCWRMGDHGFESAQDADCCSPFASGVLHEIVDDSHGDKVIFLNSIIEMMKDFSPSERSVVIGRLRSVSPDPKLPRQLLNWDEVLEMSRSGVVQFGAHTVEHEILDRLPIPRIREEIVRSRREIERRLGTRIWTFAYPNGNFDNDIQTILWEHEFSGAVTTRKGFVGRNVRLMEIPRISVHQDICSTVQMFRSRIILERF